MQPAQHCCDVALGNGLCVYLAPFSMPLKLATLAQFTVCEAHLSAVTPTPASALMRKTNQNENFTFQRGVDHISAGHVGVTMQPSSQWTSNTLMSWIRTNSLCGVILPRDSLCHRTFPILSVSLIRQEPAPRPEDLAGGEV